MMRLTKKLRHSIYVEALKVYKEEGAGNHLGLCFALTVANSHLNLRAKVPWPYKDLHAYSEIYKFKPSAALEYSFASWFNHDSTGIQKRIDILEQAIKETEYEKKTTKSKT